MKRNLKNQILQLRSQGKSYLEICKILNCNKSLVSYHCGEGQKNKTLNRTKRKRSKAHPFQSKLECFSTRKHNIKKQRQPINKDNKIFYQKVHTFLSRGTNMSEKFTVEDVINKFGENPICYLTGESIDINKPRTYHFDHKVPVSRGGTNTLDNLGICTQIANYSKRDLTHDEFLEFCKTVLIHHGYDINKP